MEMRVAELYWTLLISKHYHIASYGKVNSDIGPLGPENWQNRFMYSYVKTKFLNQALSQSR